MRPHAFLLFGLLALAAPGVAHAQALDLSQGGPITITARDGLEWRQAQQEVIAIGDAQAVRQNVTVRADRLIAYYRKKAAPPGTPAPSAASPAPAAASAAAPSPADTEGNEIYRLEAVGHVEIFTPTDRAQGDRAVYDMDKAVLVMTGHDLRLTTPSDVLTARDSLEYWPQQRMAVARGNAVVVTKDARRVSADVLVAYTSAPDTPPAGQAAAKPQPAKAAPGAAPADPLAASGKLRMVEAFGNVSIRTPTDTVTGDRGIYEPATGLARLVGHVHITRGENQLNGEEAQVDLKSGVSRLIAGSGKGARVRGLVLPNQGPGAAALTTPPGATPADAGKPDAAKAGAAAPDATSPAARGGHS